MWPAFTAAVIYGPRRTVQLYSKQNVWRQKNQTENGVNH